MAHNMNNIRYAFVGTLTLGDLQIVVNQLRELGIAYNTPVKVDMLSERSATDVHDIKTVEYRDHDADVDSSTVLITI